MKIDSNKALVEAPIQTVFDFLINCENLYHILPQDKMSDWEATNTSCSFKIQGGFVIPLIQIETVSPTTIVMKSGEKAPFSFTLTVNLMDVNGATEGVIAFDGDVNVFMKMLVEKPLTNLFNYMIHKTQKYFAPES